VPSSLGGGKRHRTGSHGTGSHRTFQCPLHWAGGSDPVWIPPNSPSW